MRISIANKTLTVKPYDNAAKASYFHNLTFKTGNFDQSTFRKIVENGCTITYTYNNDVFGRENSYMTNNYRGTDFIVVDVDKCDKSPETFIHGLRYQPTFVHTTFSNLTPCKDNLFCFHLVYCFDKFIEGEDNFRVAFDKITEDYKKHVDNAAKDCHRVMFTSNGKLPNFKFIETGITYKTNEFINDTFDTFENFVSDNTSVTKNQSSYKSNSTNNIQALSKNVTSKQANNFSLDADFFNDLNTMPRGQFLANYLVKYPVISCTIPTEDTINTTDNGIQYADLRNTVYYEVPSKYRYNPDTGKRQVVKVEIGKRSNSLLYDCYNYIKCNPDITKEWLVVELVNEVYRHYDNSDGELTNKKIISIAQYGWNNIEKINIQPLNKKFKILLTENMTKKQAVGQLNKILKDNQIGELIDLDMTVEDNLKLMRDNGVKCTKQRLMQFLEDYNLELLSTKELRNEKIASIYQENKGKTLRELEEICKGKGLNVTYRTIARIIKQHTVKTV